MNDKDMEHVFSLLDNADRKTLSVALNLPIKDVTDDDELVSIEIRDQVGLNEDVLFSDFEDLTKNHLYLIKK